MAVDDLGNSRIDFVWGNFPLQPNHNDNNSERWGMSPYPGDGEAEYYTSSDSAVVRQRYGDGLSNQLQALDSHVIAMRHWANYPHFSENTGNTLTTDWWSETDLPAYQYPNIIGLTPEEGVAQLKECGVDPKILVDLKFDQENPYNGFIDNQPIDPLNAPQSESPGIIVWRYESPTTQIGIHWDGRPWYASESNGKIMDSNRYPSNKAPVSFAPSGEFLYWHTFVVLQTTDPTKNSYEWYNW